MVVSSIVAAKYMCVAVPGFLLFEVVEFITANRKGLKVLWAMMDWTAHNTAAILTLR